MVLFKVGTALSADWMRPLRCCSLYCDPILKSIACLHRAWLSPNPSLTKEERIENRLLRALSVRRSARST
jgi:hypothetical protein